MLRALNADYDARSRAAWSSSARSRSASPNELHRHELVPARSAHDRWVVVAYRPGGVLIVEIEQPEAPRVLWMEHWAEGDRHVTIQKVLPVGDVPLHYCGLRRAHVLREGGTRRKKPVEERHASSLPKRAPAQRPEGARACARPAKRGLLEQLSRSWRSAALRVEQHSSRLAGRSRVPSKEHARAARRVAVGAPLALPRQHDDFG
jgi:hypothetical protein